jgi:hypothetical protein
MKLVSYLSILCWLVILSSCNSEGNKRKDIAQETEIIPNHELIVSDNMIVIENYESDLEWDMVSRSKIRIEGKDLYHAIKLLACDSPSRVIIKGEHTNPMMKIEYKPIDIWESGLKKNCQVVLDSLKKYYPFNIHDDIVEMKVIEVQSIDSTLLIPRNDKALGTSVQESGKIFTYKNYTLDSFFKEMEKELDIIFEVNLESKAKYDIKINLVNVEKALSQLKSEYGIALKETKKPVNVKIVEFTE